MRQIAPWALLVVLLVGVGVGAVVGQAQAPGQTPTQWVDGVLAATKAAGTARMTFSIVSTSSDPALRDSSRGSGVVDFRAGSARSTEVSFGSESSSTDGVPVHTSVVRNVNETIDIGKFSWQLADGSWTKTPRLRSAEDPLGLEDALGPFTLGSVGGGEPVVDTQDEGQTSVGGVAVTRYVLTVSAPPSCRAAVRAAVAAGTYIDPTTLWVDTQGRLVQARSALHLNLRPPKSVEEKINKLEEKSQKQFEKEFPGAPKLPTFTIPSGVVVFVLTLHLADFGAPVHITAPVITRQPGSQSGASTNVQMQEVPIEGVGGAAPQSHGCGTSQLGSASRALGSVSGVSSSVGSSSSTP